MFRGVLRTARYARSWKVGSDVWTEEVEVDRSGAKVPATLVRPLRARGPLPGWIALGGVSRMGRHHPQLVRFAQALASSGAAVLVPEIPEWRRLELAPRAVAPTLRGSIDRLRSSGYVTGDPLGLIGFSFGAPQVAIAAARGDLGEEVSGIVLFGGYCSLGRTITCALTGKHEWNGVEHRLHPDPFGGWVAAANYLTEVPGFEDAHEVAAALRQLAEASSGQRIPAWDARHDPLIARLRESLPQRRRALFDVFATPSSEGPREPEEGRCVAALLTDACRRVEPLLDPSDELTRIDLPTRLIHGRGDRLIPYTEGLRLQQGLPRHVRRGLTITGLFNHSADVAPAGIVHRTREKMEMFGAIRGMINTV